MMTEKRAGVFLLAVILTFSMGLAGCGKEKDPQTTEVMKLSVTPDATPTPTPKVIQASAVTTNGDLTMVNEFRVSEDTAMEEHAVPDTSADPADDGTQE